MSFPYTCVLFSVYFFVKGAHLRCIFRTLTMQVYYTYFGVNIFGNFYIAKDVTNLSSDQ